jgi:hypothetical protein
LCHKAGMCRPLCRQECAAQAAKSKDGSRGAAAGLGWSDGRRKGGGWVGGLGPVTQNNARAARLRGGGAEPATAAPAVPCAAPPSGRTASALEQPKRLPCADPRSKHRNAPRAYFFPPGGSPVIMSVMSPVRAAGGCFRRPPPGATLLALGRLAPVHQCRLAAPAACICQRQAIRQQLRLGPTPLHSIPMMCTMPALLCPARGSRGGMFRRAAARWSGGGCTPGGTGTPGQRPRGGRLLRISGGELPAGPGRGPTCKGGQSRLAPNSPHAVVQPSVDGHGLGHVHAPGCARSAPRQEGGHTLHITLALRRIALHHDHAPSVFLCPNVQRVSCMRSSLRRAGKWEVGSRSPDRIAKC